MKIKYVVAIDAGMSTGVGIYSKKTNKVLHWCTKDFHSVQEFLSNTFEDKSEVKIIVEVPAAFLYDRNAAEDNSGVPDDSRIKIRDRKMLNIGGVRREAQLLAAALRLQGWLVYEVLPVREKKWDMEKFRLYTGRKTSIRANAHEMDAVRLAIHYADYKGKIGEEDNGTKRGSKGR